MSGHQKARKYTLDCLHVLWLTIPPYKDDVLWCRQCKTYEPLLLSEASRHGRIIDPQGEFWSERFGRKFKGGCLYQGCEYESLSESTWDSLQTKMHTHYMREHTRFGTLQIQTADRLPRNSPPPF